LNTITETGPGDIIGDHKSSKTEVARPLDGLQNTDLVENDSELENPEIQSVSVPDPTSLKTELRFNDTELAYPLAGSYNPKNDTDLVAHGDENDPKKDRPDPIGLDIELKFNDTGYIIHESTKKLVHPIVGSSHKFFKDNTNLIICDKNDRDNPEELKVRFVPVPGYGHFGFIEHVSSGKIIQPIKEFEENNTIKDSDYPKNDTFLVYHSDRHSGALFGFDEENHEIHHHGGRIWHPYKGLPNPEDGTKCVLYGDSHQVSKFYFGDIDGNPMSPYPPPNLSGEWKLVRAFITPEDNGVYTINYKVGKSQPKSRSVWKGTTDVSNTFSASNQFSADFMNKADSATWKEEKEDAHRVIVTKGETTVVWQYVFIMEQYGDELSFKSKIIRNTDSLDDKPQLTTAAD
jgi:hypothetical protein